MNVKNGRAASNGPLGNGGKDFLRNLLQLCSLVHILGYFRIEQMESLDNFSGDIRDYLNGVAEGRLLHVIAMDGPMRIARLKMELFELNEKRIRDAERMSDYLERTEFQCAGQWKSFDDSTRERLMPALVTQIGIVSTVRAWENLHSPKKLSLDGLIGFLSIALISQLRLQGEDLYSDYIGGHLAKLKLGKRDFGIYVAGLLLDCCHPAKREMVSSREDVNETQTDSSKMEKTLKRVLEVLSTKPVTPYEKPDRRGIRTVLVPPSNSNKRKFRLLKATDNRAATA